MSKLYKAKSTMRFLAMKCKPLVKVVRMMKCKWNNADNVGKILRSDGAEVAARIQRILTDAGIETSLACGSLLGVVREGHFMAHDDDLDFMVVVTPGFDWDAVRIALEPEGFTLRYHYMFGNTITEQTYATDSGFRFDIFGFVADEETSTMRLFYYAQRRDMIYENPGDSSVWYRDLPLCRNMVPVEVEGHTLVIAGNAEDILAVHYGPDWRVPDTGWSPKEALVFMDGVIGKRVVEA